MGWLEDVKGNPLDWLLEEDESGTRYLALRDLVGLGAEDAQLCAAQRSTHERGPIAAILARQDPRGYWIEPGPGYNPKYRSTVWALIQLAQMGASAALDERIGRGCEYLLGQALAAGGQWSASGAPSGTADCLQGNLCWALTALGCEDPRLGRAFDWLARSVTGEGVAPLKDKPHPVGDTPKPLRYYAGKCGPYFACGSNGGQPCGWGATKVMLALGSLPATRRTPQVEAALRMGVDFLFSVDPLWLTHPGAQYPAVMGARPNRSWWKLGFPVFYVTDVLQIGEALAGLGLAGDPRLATLRGWLLEKQDSQGRWALEYDLSGKVLVEAGEKGQPNRWVTLRALRFLKAAGGQPLNSVA